MTTITFVRHGNTDWNRERRTQGHQNNPLNETGLRQASLLAERLAGGTWDIIVSSDLLRARMTSDTISERLARSVDTYDERLREIGSGLWEGTCVEDRVRRWGPDWREKRTEVGAESLEAVRARGLDFVREMTEKHPGKQIMAVSHGVLIAQTLKGLLNDDQIGDHLENTSVTTVSLKDGAWVCTLYNCAKHLEGPDETAVPPEGTPD